MSLALTIMLIAFCVQGLVKFAVGFLVPHPTRIGRISSNYRRDGRVISIYDSITPVIIAGLVALLFLTDMQYRSFVTGLVVGMLLIQLFFHRFSETLAPDKAPESPAPPRKLMSYAIQANPGLAWRERRASAQAGGDVGRRLCRDRDQALRRQRQHDLLHPVRRPCRIRPICGSNDEAVSRGASVFRS